MTTQKQDIRAIIVVIAAFYITSAIVSYITQTSTADAIIPLMRDIATDIIAAAIWDTASYKR